ncbi:MAG: hypothetical protein JW936_02020 [Sedimentisphaerales bacterium]|nr:hypothetical protein [Sedimentisphaerales bacterium]
MDQSDSKFISTAKVKKTEISDAVGYQLRYQILPGNDLKQRTSELVDFCQSHHIREVALFFAAEEWNNGLLSAAEEDLWFATIEQAKAILEKAGVAVSLNPWMTTLHAARGRRFPADRNFAPMVSPLGEVSQACASFACPNWQRYIVNLYTRFARLGFRTIWIEDDFRYHNHGPLSWGGGFEPEMLARFAERIGCESIAREELVSKILQPGEPHPWRAQWLDTWRDCQLEVAAMIARAVRDNSPCATAIGLMSSLPRIHASEGRDWQGFFAVCGEHGPVVHRPHFAGYGEAPGSDKVFSIISLDSQKQLRPEYCAVSPEIENHPFTNWRKSDTQCWCEMALAKFYGSESLFLDLHPHSGQCDEPEIGKLLDRSYPALDWISQRFSKSFQTNGIGIPWRQDAARLVHTKVGDSLPELETASYEPPAWLLISYGVPVTCQTQQVNAIFGDTAWLFNDDQWLEMLKGGLLLDGDSAAIACQRGFGQYLGVEVGQAIDRESDSYSIERVVASHMGVPKGYCLNANHSVAQAYPITPLPGADEWTEILRPDGTRFGAGIVAYENSLGGRVVTYAVAEPACLPASYQRQKIVQAIVGYLNASNPLPMVTGGPHLLPIYFSTPEQSHLVILNAWPDAAQPTIKIANQKITTAKGYILSPLQPPEPIDVEIVHRQNSTELRCARKIGYFNYFTVTW